MQRIGFECLAVVFFRNFSESAGTPEIHYHRREQHQKCRQTGFDLDMVEEQSLNSFINDDHASDQQKPGFDKSGKVLDLFVAVLVVGIRRLIREAYRNKSYDGGD